MVLKWYIVHVYSGFENKVKAALGERIASSPPAESVQGSQEDGVRLPKSDSTTGCPQIADGVPVGRITSPKMTETSGVVFTSLLSTISKPSSIAISVI